MYRMYPQTTALKFRLVVVHKRRVELEAVVGVVVEGNAAATIVVVRIDPGSGELNDAPTRDLRMGGSRGCERG